MYYLKFTVEGIFNSFKVPFFRTYQKTFLAPPKTNIIGMFANIMKKTEKWFYETLLNNDIKVSVVINSIDGRIKDLWSYKTFENRKNADGEPTMYGKSVIRRDKLYKAKYTIYCTTENECLYNDLYETLLNPMAVPALGLDDEMVIITDVMGYDEFSLDLNNDARINSVFMDDGNSYKAFVSGYGKSIEFPTANAVPLHYDVKFDKNGKRTVRVPENELKQVEYINCEVELENVLSFTDGVNKVVFY